MSKHTPGPWTVATHEMLGLTVTTEDDTMVAAVITRAPTGSSSRDNARLIAAAPDLLAALCHTEKFMEELMDRRGLDVYGSGVLDVIRAAIAKVEG